jgi:hypothetical protein
LDPRKPHRKRLTDTPVRVSEQAIEKYGEKAIAMYAYVAVRAINSAVYPFGEHVRDRFGWSRSKFYNSMGLLVKTGLAQKQECGHWMLVSREELAGVKHRCHLLITRRDTQRDVLDQVRLKGMEMVHRQVSGAIVPKNKKSKARRERIRLLELAEQKRYNPTVLSEATPLLGEGRSKLVKRVSKGEAPMNTEKLMNALGLGRTATFAWKKRAKAKQWFRQRDRSWVIPAKIQPGVPFMMEDLEQGYRGRISQSHTKGFIFHQASCYKMLLSYGK